MAVGKRLSISLVTMYGINEGMATGDKRLPGCHFTFYPALVMVILQFHVRVMINFPWQKELVLFLITLNFKLVVVQSRQVNYV